MGKSKIIFAGNTLIDLTTDNVVADALVVGHTAHGANGEVVEGSNPYELTETNQTVDEQTDLIAQISAALEGKAGGGGGSDNQAKEIIERTITEISDSSVINVGAHAFRGCTTLSKASFPNCESIGTYAFSECSNLTEAIYPNCTEAGTYAFTGASNLVTVDFPKLKQAKSFLFRNCHAIKTISFPSVEDIRGNAFQDMNALEKADFLCATSLSTNVFYSCEKLTALILRSPTVATLGGTNSFTRTAVASGTGYIYVPAALVEQYKVETNWSTYAAQFRALEDYTVDGTTTGALDESKI